MASFTPTTIEPKVLRYTSYGEVFYLMGTAGTTYTKGDVVVVTQATGLVTAATGDEKLPTFRVAKTVTCPALSVAPPRPADFAPELVSTTASSRNDCLVACEWLGPSGLPVLLMNFANQATDDVADYTAATPSLTLTSALGGNDDPNGGIVYVIAGPGAGCADIIQDYVDATKIVTLGHITETALTTASDVIILEGEGGGAARGVGLFGRVELKDKNELSVDDGTDATGPYLVYASWQDIATYVSKGQLPVIRAGSLLLA